MTNDARLMTMPSPTAPTKNVYPLIVAQYAIKGHRRRTEHWALVLLYSRLHGLKLELKGNTDTFTYLTERLTAFERAQDLRGGCLVGWVDAERVQALVDRLKKVRVRRNDPAWDGQDWVMEALRALKEEHMVFSRVDENWLRTELMEDLERSESGLGETVEERLFP